MFSGVAVPKVARSWWPRFPASATEEYPLGLPRHQRLRRSADIQRVQRTGDRIRRRLLMILFVRNGTDQTRVGLTVSRKVGNAVNRNRVKRWLREAIRHQGDELPAGFDVVVVAHPQAANATFASVDDEVNQGLKRMGRAE